VTARRLIATETKPLSSVLDELGETNDAVSDGRVFVGPKRATSPDVLVNAGDEVVVQEPTATPDGVRLLSEWRGLHAVYKPAGLSSEPDKRGGASLLREAAELVGVPEVYVHVVTRLDAGTSGVAVVAAGPEAKKLAADMQRSHGLERRYFALADGAPAPGEDVWDAAIGTGRGGAPTLGGNGARAARTRYAVVASFAGTRAAGVTSFLIAEPETGRTHQIRLHAAANAAPLLGDGAHGGPRRLATADGAVVSLPRPMLHAARIRAVVGGKTHWLAKAPLPDDFVATCRAVGGDATKLELDANARGRL
jgi:23S rRNA-/tRNA-specific pseudouridylate synthase